MSPVTHPRPWYLALLLGGVVFLCAVSAGATGGAALGLTWHRISRAHPSDLEADLAAYSLIGAFTGMLAWHVGRLVWRGRVHIAGVAAVLAFPLLIMLHFTGKGGWGHAVNGVAVFGTVFLVACVAAAMRRRRAAGELDQRCRSGPTAGSRISL